MRSNKRDALRRREEAAARPVQTRDDEEPEIIFDPTLGSFVSRRSQDPPPELPSKKRLLASLLVTFAFIGGGIAGAVVADAVAHPDSDYTYGVGAGRLVAGFFIGGITAAALTWLCWLVVSRWRSAHRSPYRDDPAGRFRS